MTKRIQFPQTRQWQITAAQYDKQDRLISLNGAIERNLTYSDDGEMTMISNCLGEKKFEYDFFGNLKKVTLPNGKVIEYKLDAFHRRVARLVNGQVKNYYLWQDQTHLWAILSPTGQIQIQYVYGIYSQAPIYFIRNGGAKFYVVPNDRGDIKYVIDSFGKLVQNIEYDEYGMVLSDSSVTTQTPDGLQPLGFASGLYDQDTKLVLFNARSYDPVVGRWTSKDSIGFGGGQINLYGYAFNDPVNFIDPSGKFGLAGVASGFISGLVGGYISGGTIPAALAGGTAGAIVGFVNPFASSAAGAFAGDVASSLLGQVVGNVMTDQPTMNINLGAAAFSGFGSAVGVQAAGAMACGQTGSAIVEGTASGLSELFGGTLDQTRNFSPLFAPR